MIDKVQTQAKPKESTSVTPASGQFQSRLFTSKQQIEDRSASHNAIQGDNTVRLDNNFSELDVQAKDFKPKGHGRPLPEPVRHKMENALGASFSDVRVHEGPEAQTIGAQAYTRGNHVHFAPGRYNPTRVSGQALIGHELTHVMQQREGRVARPRGTAINYDADLEKEADSKGRDAAVGRSTEGFTRVGDQTNPESVVGGGGAGVIQCGGKTLAERAREEAEAAKRAEKHRQLNQVQPSKGQQKMAQAVGDTAPIVGVVAEEAVKAALESRHINPELANTAGAVINQAVTRSGQAIAIAGQKPYYRGKAEDQTPLIDTTEGQAEYAPKLSGDRPMIVDSKGKPLNLDPEPNLAKLFAKDQGPPDARSAGPSSLPAPPPPRGLFFERGRGLLGLIKVERRKMVHP